MFMSPSLLMRALAAVAGGPAPLMLGTGILNRGVVAVDDDGAAAAHGNVTGEISGGAVAGNQRAGGVVHRGVARNGVAAPS
ncbi:hypothetical protein KCP73_14595 [Salmonella enterica subsp. enterica]|nr:hypothetical protein KCP73_14595 [Salmonella enterica subsp. enterica]